MQDMTANQSTKEKNFNRKFQRSDLEDVADFASLDFDSKRKLREIFKCTNLESLMAKDNNKINSLLNEISPVLNQDKQSSDPLNQNEHSAEPVNNNLSQACLVGDKERIVYLLKNGHNINEVSSDGETPLTSAITSGLTEIVELLLEIGADPDLRGKKVECTALMEAASAGFIDIVRLLLNKNADVTNQSNSGNTALHYAASGGHLECVELLVCTNPSIIEIQNENGHTALMEAASNGFVDVARLLLENGADINAHSNEFKESALTLASYKGHTSMVEFLLKSGADHDHRTDEMHTALMEAAMDGHVDVAKLLLQYGAQVNMPADSFESPLTLAACGGHTNLACLLISYGANIEEVNDEGYTPLMEAAREGHEEMVALLLACGAKINVQTEETQETALTLAACNGFCEVADILLRCGADIELGCSTPLMEASQEGHFYLVGDLLDQGADVNAQTATGETALHYACENGHVDVCRLLLNRGASLDHTSEGGRNPLMKASRAGHLECVQLFVEKGCPVNLATTHKEHTALSLACNGGHVKVVEYLLSCGADPLFPLKDSSTMVIEAARSGHTEIVKLLIDYPNRLLTMPLPPPDSLSNSDSSNHQLPVQPEVSESNQTTPNAQSEIDSPSNLQQISHLLHASECLSSLGPDTSEDKSATVPLSACDISPPSLISSSCSGTDHPPVEPCESSSGMDEDEDDLSEGRLTFSGPISQYFDSQPPEDSVEMLLMERKPISSSDCSCDDNRTTMDSITSSQNNFRQHLQHKLSAECLDELAKWRRQNSDIPADLRRDASIRKPKSIDLNSSGDNAKCCQSVVRAIAQNQALSSVGDSKTSVRKNQPSSNKLPSCGEVSSPSDSDPDINWLTPRVPPIGECSEPEKYDEDDSLKCRKCEAKRNVALASKLFAKSVSKSSNEQDKSNQSIAKKSHSQNKPPSGGKAKIDVNSCIESTQESALSLACGGGHVELVELLLDQGANLEHRDKKSYTPLHTACQAGQLDVARLLLDRHADIEAQIERNKETALSIAAANGKLEIVEELLNRGANKEHRNISDYTPLSLAASGNFTSVIQLLLKRGAEINSRTGSKLGISPLMLAAMNGHKQAVSLLLDNGSDINAQIETNKNTALTLACFQGRHEVVGLLVEHKANIEHRAKTGLTPLMEAASGGYVEVAKVLLEAGADVNATPVPSSRDTSLTIAADKGHLKLVNLLLEYKANVDARNKKGATALWLASNGGHLDIVQSLTNALGDVNACDNRKISCLMAAFRKGHVKVVKHLVKFVSKFPTDSECQRTLELIKSEKELTKRCTQCMTIIKQAKEKQEVEANKHAEYLLEQLTLEREEEERKQVALAKKRERKRQKRKAKQGKGNSGELDDKNDESESCDLHSQNSLPKENEKQKLDLSISCKEETISSRDSKETPTDANVISLTKLDSSNSNQSSSNAKSKKKKNNKESSPNHEVSSKFKEPVSLHITTITNGSNNSVKINSDKTNSISKSNSKPCVNPPQLHPSSSSDQLIEKKKEKSRKKSNKKNSKDTNQQKINSNGSVSKNDLNDSRLSDVHNEWPNNCLSDDFLNELDYNTWCEIAGETSKPIMDDQWKTVPKRKLAIVVQKKDIGKVIGQTGSTVKALRLHTGAHIDIEDIKEGMDVSERTIHIRGQPESVSKAKDMIDDLISGKITSKEIASLASPKRCLPVNSLAPPTPLLSGNLSMKSNSNSKHLSQNKPLPIRKASTAMPVKQSSTSNDTNILRVGGPVPWVSTVTSKDDEKNFASVAAAGIITPNNTINAPNNSFKSLDSTFPTICEAVNYGNKGSNTSSTVSNLSCYHKPSVLVEAKPLVYGVPVSGTRDDSFNQRTYEPSSPSLISNHNSLSTKSFARAPGSERHQRLTGTPDHSPHLYQNSNFPPQSISPSSSFTNQNEWNANFSHIDQSPSLPKAPQNLYHQITISPDQIQANCLTPISNSSVFKNMELLNHLKNHFSPPTVNNFQPNNEPFTDLPRVVPSLNPQARSFSPSVSISPCNAHVSHINSYVTPPELKELPRVSSELNPSAVTFEPQKPLISAPKSDSNSNTLSQSQAPLNFTGVSSTGEVHSEIYNTYSNALEVGFRDARVSDLSPEEISTSVKPIGAERKNSNLPIFSSNVCGSELLKSSYVPVSSSHSHTSSDSIIWRTYNSTWSQPNGPHADWN